MSAALEPYIQRLDAVLEDKNPFTDGLNAAEQKTGISRRNLVLGGAALILVWLAIGIGSSLVCSVVCFIYPAYKSFKAVESPQGDDDKQWLTYWIVYSTFNILEYFADLILFWIPLYDLLKCLFLVWCMWPVENNGSVIVYNTLLRPFLLQNESRIDARLSKVTGQVNKYVSDAQKEANAFANSSTGQMLAATTNVAMDSALDSVSQHVDDGEKDKDL